MNASSSWVRSCPGTGKPRRQILPLQKQVFIANPVGAAPQTAEPFWCLTASLLISLLPSCLAPPSLSADHCLFNAFKLQNLLPLFCCSSTWITGAKKKAGNKARTKQRERAGVGEESRNSRLLHFSCSRTGLCLAAFTLRVQRAGLTVLGEATP